VLRLWSAERIRAGMNHSRATAEAARSANARERVLEAVTELACREGYGQLTAERVLAAAGVSRASFYQYFSNVNDCFVAAYRHHADQLVADVADAVSGSNERELVLLDTLLDAAVARPQASRLLMSEGHAAGIMGLQLRADLIGRLEHTIGDSAEKSPKIDLPMPILVGGLFRFLSMRMAEARIDGELRGALRQWVKSFAMASSQQPWSPRLTPVPPSSPTQGSRSFARPQLNQLPRERVLDATAVSICEKGYRDLTVADIVAAAGLSRRCFYNEFANRSAAAIAAYERGFARALGACTPAYFSTDDWPERIWESASAFTGFLAREPHVAYFGFVECYAISRGYTSRIHATQVAFTLFLEEGYRQSPHTHLLPRTCLALIVTSVAELGLQASLRTPGMDMRRMQPLAVYLTLAPFVGRESAGSFVAGKLARSNPTAPAAA
jgi:AcrR family transcriptional regulator